MEVIFTLGILGVLSAMAAVQISQTNNAMRGDAAMRIIQSQLVQAREMAITQRKYMRVTFDVAGKLVSIVREDTVAATTTLTSVTFEGGASFTLVAGVPDTPDAFGKASATSFTSVNGTFASAVGTNTVAKFSPDGTLVDWNGALTNGTVFTAVTGIKGSARAVTVLGSTGRVRGYRWNGQVWTIV
jgi:Tfp pilus assembly protein FimT